YINFTQLCWISVSESRTVDAQSGGDVTLLCSNISQETTQTDWFRLSNGTKATCVSSIYRPDGPPSFCKGFEHGFEMSTNVTMIFLKIKRVNLSDSGFYFCGFYKDQHTVIGETTYLNVQELCNGTADLMSVILGGLTVLLTIVVIVLIIRICRLQKGTCDIYFTFFFFYILDLNYAALSFKARPKRNRRPVTGREVEPNVVYAATR
uniref:Immunoglobulin domain-containing protein n=1 Tax=Echeneis naucrates TaxID=173247 RepID=A0A665VIP6_ECHNA